MDMYLSAQGQGSLAQKSMYPSQWPAVKPKIKMLQQLFLLCHSCLLFRVNSESLAVAGICEISQSPFAKGHIQHLKYSLPAEEVVIRFFFAYLYSSLFIYIRTLPAWVIWQGLNKSQTEGLTDQTNRCNRLTHFSSRVRLFIDQVQACPNNTPAEHLTSNILRGHKENMKLLMFALDQSGF